MQVINSVLESVVWPVMHLQASVSNSAPPRGIRLSSGSDHTLKQCETNNTISILLISDWVAPVKDI